MLRIIIGGDLAPTPSNIGMFNSGDLTSLLGDELLLLWNAADMRIFNLEVPLTDKTKPISKNGPSLIAPTSAVKGIKALNPSLVALANNHILDQGIQGLESTKRVLHENGIPFTGVGGSLSEAGKPYILECAGMTVGVYACAEHEFSTAAGNTPGANPFDPMESLDHIAAMKARYDRVIVLYHGGKEDYRYPSPYLQKACRKMAQKGADLVVCQHSHCIGCYEEYKGSTIVYGQGNFLFDHSDGEVRKTGLLLQVNISGCLKVGYIPAVKAGNGVRLASGRAAEDILAAFRLRSDEILQDGFVEQHYRRYAAENILSYLRSITGPGRWLSRIDRSLLGEWLLKRRFGNKRRLALRNYIECEAHRELIIQGLEEGRKSIWMDRW